MKTLFSLKPAWLFAIYIILDGICIGMGMGVPIFCILFGFILGWFLVRYATFTTRDISQALRKVLQYAGLLAGFTFVAMFAIWAPLASYLFDTSKDLVNTGIPMILYQPLPSLIGWIVLMILISPFLQLLTTLFSAYLSLLTWINKPAQ